MEKITFLEFKVTWPDLCSSDLELEEKLLRVCLTVSKPEGWSKRLRHQHGPAVAQPEAKSRQISELLAWLGASLFRFLFITFRLL